METLFLQTTRGLQGALLAEAKILARGEPLLDGVRLRGPDGLHRRANLTLRCATRVWLQLSCAAPPGGKTARFADARWLDTSGEALSKRGYRQEGSRAPLEETLAAGLLALAGHDGTQPLWDPLCGSGTIAIEAALIGRRRAPGLGRRFAFEGFPDHDAAVHAAEVAELERRALPAARAPILGTDLNAGALGVARRNAKRAGVLADLTLERHDAERPRSCPAETLVVTNLPYGLRVGEPKDLPRLYRAVAEGLRASGVRRAALLVKDSRAAEWLGIAGAKAHPVDNGGLRCELLCAEL